MRRAGQLPGSRRSYEGAVRELLQSAAPGAGEEGSRAARLLLLRDGADWVERAASELDVAAAAGVLLLPLVALLPRGWPADVSDDVSNGGVGADPFAALWPALGAAQAEELRAVASGLMAALERGDYSWLDVAEAREARAAADAAPPRGGAPLSARAAAAAAHAVWLAAVRRGAGEEAWVQRLAALAAQAPAGVVNGWAAAALATEPDDADMAAAGQADATPEAAAGPDLPAAATGASLGEEVAVLVEDSEETGNAAAEDDVIAAAAKDRGACEEGTRIEVKFEASEPLPSPPPPPQAAAAAASAAASAPAAPAGGGAAGVQRSAEAAPPQAAADLAAIASILEQEEQEEQQEQQEREQEQVEQEEQELQGQKQRQEEEGRQSSEAAAPCAHGRSAAGQPLDGDAALEPEAAPAAAPRAAPAAEGAGRPDSGADGGWFTKDWVVRTELGFILHQMAGLGPWELDANLACALEYLQRRFMNSDADAARIQAFERALPGLMEGGLALPDLDAAQQEPRYVRYCVAADELRKAAARGCLPAAAEGGALRPGAALAWLIGVVSWKVWGQMLEMVMAAAGEEDRPWGLSSP
ncbi:hypothetical protein MNEG_16452 [Monoraphidium neglectum]|uniref:Uncharacterized protein n=1 Tax=Monoraphidium neglectum TaxID=145388 RepID=A0A0D2IU62_9CHLO|nr:hypothetical protein MNEG_16452 [Monoraphidium neglectum]KIY91512.1 hypothetical protein MNEG_16452 [Monoraphidium neglectum]|eukprot:XP_013890532.1 hypothetical protein MNEG_16452 [Monoraphidium neglectum]